MVDIQTFLINPDQGLYRIYVPYPASRQILRYDPTADGGGFSAPAPYFISESVDVAAFRQLYVDGDVYAVTADNLEQYFSGRQTAFSLDPPPDDDRPATRPRIRIARRDRRCAATATCTSGTSCGRASSSTTRPPAPTQPSISPRTVRSR